MKRFFIIAVCVNLLVLLLLAAPLITAEQAGVVQSDPGQIKQLQKERVENLETIVQMMTRLYMQGVAGNDIKQVFSAEIDLINAKLEMTDDLKERIALLEDQSNRAKTMLELAEQRSRLGTLGQLDALSAKSFYLKAKIDLLKEKQKLKASP
jgi:hypothetical protein